MEDRKTYTFPTDVFYKLQNFLDERILEEANTERTDSALIDALLDMEYYLEETYTENEDTNTVEIELDHEDYEFLFNILLIPAIYSYDSERLYKRLDNLYNRLEKICDRAISNRKELEDILNQQTSLVNEQSEFIDFLMDINSEEKAS